MRRRESLLTAGRLLAHPSAGKLLIATGTLAAAASLTAVMPAAASVTGRWLGLADSRSAVERHVNRLFSGSDSSRYGPARIECARLGAVSVDCLWTQGVIAVGGDRFSICTTTYRVTRSRASTKVRVAPRSLNVCSDTSFPDGYGT